MIKRIGRGLTLAGILAGAAAAVPSAAHAQGKIELTPFLGSYYALTKMCTDCNKDGSDVTGHQVNAFAFGGRLSYWVSNTIGVEGAFTYAPSRAEERVGISGFGLAVSGKGRIMQASGRLLYRPQRTNLHFIVGAGIVSRGDTVWQAFKEKTLAYPRPRLIGFADCSHVAIEGVTLLNSPAWTVNPVRCENVLIKGLTIINPPESPNTDAIGAKVRLLGGAVPSQQLEMACGGRYLSGSEPLLVFAAGSRSNAMTLEVTWRDGSVTTEPNVIANRHYVIRQRKLPSPEPAPVPPPPGGSISGSSNRKTAPPAGALPAAIVPECISTRRLVMASPRPEPPVTFDRGPDAR